MNKEKILEIIKNENVKFIKLMFADILGVLKTVEISANIIETALDNKIMIDGSNIKGFSDVNLADTLLAPDINSFRRLPFYDSVFGNVAMFMCDILKPDGKTAEGCTRSNLKTELKKMKELGFSDMFIGFEIEFFILKNKPAYYINTNDLLDNSGYDANEDESGGVIIMREIIFELEKLGISCLTSHHECAPSQYEITYKYSDALSACDNILITKTIITAVVKRHGCYATFMPKLSKNFAGSGLHTNVSLNNNNKNAFEGEFQISDAGKYFIGGVLTHAKGLCLLTNPTVNSYKRLTAGFEAPVNICWSVANRSAMIRVPATEGESSRIEIRNTDSSVNPYLAAAGILAAGLDGIRNKIYTEPINSNAYNLKLPLLPSSLEKAIKEFEKDEIIKKSVTPKIAALLTDLKKKETEKYNREVNSSDFDYYF